MTVCIRIITKDADKDVYVRKVEDSKDMEDVDVATKIWEGGIIATRMATARI